MRKLLLSIFLLICFTLNSKAQDEVVYDFNSGQPLSGIEQLSGSAEVVSLSTLTDNGIANNTPVLRPKTVGSPNATGVANLTEFPTGSDYTITWKEYISQGNTTYKKGFLLRGSGIGGYTTGIKRGYYFMVQNNSVTGSVNFRIMNSSATGLADIRNSGAVTIPGFAVNKACWFRASAMANVLKFEYSMDGVTFVTGATHTDAANLYPSGTTQMVFGIASPVGQFCYDNITFKSTSKGNSIITIIGAANYSYNGSPQGPTATVTGSTGAITYNYSGTGTTSYGPSAKPPVLAGTYQVVTSVLSDANYNGAVSNAFAFSITSNPEMPVVAMRRPLSPARPMFLVHVDVWSHQPQQVIDLIPLDIRPFVVINLAMSTSLLQDQGYNCAESWLNTCAQNGIWAMVQPSSGIQNSFAPDTALSAYESLFKKYPNFIGYNFCEQAWGFDASTFTSRLNLFVNLLAMGHKYGGYLYVNDCFSRTNAPWNSVSKFKKSTEFANATKVYKENMIFGNKFTSEWAYYDNESGALGAFLSGHAGNYAIRYDMYSWPWSGRGQVFGPEVVGARYPEDNRALFACPEAVMGIPIVEHMMLTGATVIDGPEVPWMSTLQRSNRLPPFDNMIADILRKVQDGTIRIPTVNEVAARTKVVFVNDVDALTTDSLFSGLYAMDGTLKNNRTWFKKSGRYASIPQLYSGDAYETSLFSGATIVKKSQYQTRWPNEQQKINEFNSLYPAEYTGDMYVSRVNNSWYSYNPWINKDIVTNASIPLKYNTCDSIALSYPAHTFSVINESNNKLQVYLNNYRTDKNNLWTDYPDDFSWFTLQSVILPQLAANPTDGTLRTSVIKVYGSTSTPVYTLTDRGRHKASTASAAWIDGVYTLSITHNGPVDLTIDCAGTASDRATAPSSQTSVAPVQPIAYNGEKQYEAEGAIITSPASVTNSPKKYHGTGFVRFSSTTSSASSVKFNVLNVDSAGTYALQIRYSTAQGNVNRVDVLVNGTKVNTPTFPATVNDTTWVLYTQKVSLNAGTGNTIELKANASGAIINIDKIYLSKKSFPFSFATVDAVQKTSSQVQIDWRVTEEQNIAKYEVLKSNDGSNFSSIFTTDARNAGESYYSYLDNSPNTNTNFYKIKSIDKNGLESYSNVVQISIKTAVMVQAESGTLGSDWDTKSAGGILYVTPKTDILNSAYPGNASKVITYNVNFEKPGSYDLYAKVLVGPGAFNDDSYYYSKGFGLKNPSSDNNEWITSNGLSPVGYTAQNDVVGSGGNTGNGQWKWINMSKFNGGEAPVSFNVTQEALTQTFQIGSRENGLQLDKFVFGSSSQSFTVKELDSLTRINIVPLVASSQELSISETAASGTIAGKLLATDADVDAILNDWKITGGTGASVFNIDALSGDVKLKDSVSLDFESNTSYSLTVTVSDGIATSVEETVTITVKNENDNIPLVTPQPQFTLSENAAAGQLVGKITATDGDDKNQPGYTTFKNWELVGNTETFSIDSVSGEIRLSQNAALDFESTTSYTLQVRVSDGKFTSAPESITIEITNENDNVPAIAAQTYAISEGIDNQSILFQASAADSDDINQPGYTTFQGWQITGGSGASIFEIDSTGVVKLSSGASLDFEEVTSYTLAIKVSDGINESQESIFTINVTNENDNAPVIAGPVSFAIDGGSSNVIGKLEATDKDDINQPGFTTIQNWTITGGGTSVFAIDPATGIISIAHPEMINFNNSSYSLQVNVSDGSNLSAPLTVNISISDKINVCHNGELISVSKNAVHAHIQHGCSLGSCSNGLVAATLSNDQLDLHAVVTPTVTIYPNPVQENLQVNLGTALQNARKVIVFNLSGQTVMQREIRGETLLSLNLARLEAGMYTLKIIADEVKTFKFIKE